MYQTLSRLRPGAFRRLLLLSSLLLWGATAPARAADTKPILLDVLVPADAELEVDGHKTRSTGEERHFESPPVEVGKTYAYSVKATWRGRIVSRRIRLSPAQLTTLDLRQDLRTAVPPAPTGSFHLLVPPSLRLTAGRDEKLTLRVKRIDFPGAIGIRFEDLPEGITATDVTLEPGETEAVAVVRSMADAVPGSHEVEVVARSGTRRDTASTTLTVVRPDKKPVNKPQSASEKISATAPAVTPNASPKTAPVQTAEKKPEPRPAAVEKARPAPKLLVQLPAQVSLRPGRTRYVEVRVRSRGGESLSEKPVVEAIGPAGGKVMGSPWTASAFTPGSAGYTVGFAFKAAPDAPEGRWEVKVVVTVGPDRVEKTLQLTVESPSRESEP